jgi:hypothetical protein
VRKLGCLKSRISVSILARCEKQKSAAQKFHGVFPVATKLHHWKGAAGLPHDGTMRRNLHDADARSARGPDDEAVSFVVVAQLGEIGIVEQARPVARCIGAGRGGGTRLAANIKPGESRRA